MSWFKHSSVIVYNPGVRTEGYSAKLAAFDLDSTLIYSSKGEKTSSSVTDWTWAYSEVKETILRYHREGWTVAILSNRRGAPWHHEAAKLRVERILSELGLKVWVLMATKVDEYRKPKTGMLSLLQELTKVEKWDKVSFYCGDAVGEESKLVRNRWSSCDRELAYNAGLLFYEPHSIFKMWPLTDIPSDVNLIMTVGAPMSGWEKYLPHRGKTLKYRSSSMYVADSSSYKHPEGTILLVPGAHPTLPQRRQVIDEYEKDGAEAKVFYLWFAAPSSVSHLEKKASLHPGSLSSTVSSAHYSASFQGLEQDFMRVN